MAQWIYSFRLATFWARQPRSIKSWCIGFLLLASLVAHSQFSYPPVKCSVADIFFIDSLHGWVLASETGKPTLFSTADGGNTWASVRTLKTIYRIFFLDARRGWALVAVQARSDLYKTVLYATEDGGHTWSKRSTVLVAKPGHADLITGFLFTDPQHGWFIERDGLVFQTIDGGRSIHEVKAVSRRESLNHIYAQGDKLWIFGKETILASFDRGQTWQFKLSGENNAEQLGEIILNSGLVLSDGHGWAAGTGAILATSDFGNSWRTVFQRDDHWFTDISFSDASHRCAVGASKLLDCTEDGGKTWTTKAILPSKELHKYGLYTRVLFTSASRCWALEQGGFLFRSDDSGNTWHAASLIESQRADRIGFKNRGSQQTHLP